MSFLTDVASEMIYPLVPIFLSGVLGANARFIGVIEGAAESVAAVLKVVSGGFSDRIARRKPLVVAGYAVATIARPFIGMAESASQVLSIRLLDRVGKGIRTAPRDALLADSVSEAARGRAYGFHRAADHAGAVVGPLVAFALLWALTGNTVAGSGAVDARSLRLVFWLSLVPGALALAVLWVAVREEPRTSHSPEPESYRPRGRPFWGYMASVLLFTLGNSTDAFLLLRAQQLGVAVALAPILWSLLHVVKTMASTYGGALSDRFGRKRMIVTGWLLYALVYTGFAIADTAWHVWALFAVYGVFFALTEGPERALVADLVPVRARGTAFGWYSLITGIGALPASLIFGAIWDAYGPPSAFLLGAGLAGAAVVMLVLGKYGMRSGTPSSEIPSRRSTR